jgi:hypothetical protein
VTIGSWLSERTPKAPPRLAARVKAALGDSVSAPGEQAPVECIAAAERLLRELLARPSAGRDCALDLLTVDALVTYAFEAAAEVPDTLGEQAADAARRLAAAVA